MSVEVSQTVLNLETGNTASFKFFTDDTIETVQNRIGALIGMHPDRLRIYVEGQFDGDYYTKDSRKWENLFLRMSPEGKPVRKGLEYYNASRDPPFVFDEKEYDKSTWMTIDSKSDAPFRERRLLGVSEERSWVFPQNNTDTPEHLPPSSQISTDVRALFKTLHPYEIVQFVVIPHSKLVPQLELIYYPRLRPTSPAKLPEDIIKNVARQSELVRAISSFEYPRASKVSINQVRWKLPLVNTDFGDAVRNRFEQIFYGTTVSSDVPVISFFSSRQEQSRHKFFTKDGSKDPELDLRTWTYWWNATKPSKNKPSLLIFRGKSRNNFDRITINSTEITLSCSRGDDGSETDAELRDKIKEFLLSIDGLNAFLDPADVEDSRWELQDMSGVAHFSTELKEADFRRFDCLRSIYDVTDKDKLVFKFLRTDNTEVNLSNNEMRIITLLKENEGLSPDDVHEQIPDLSIADITILLESVKQTISDNPDIVDRQYSTFPTFKFSANKVAVTHAPDMRRVISYISALRDILMNPDNPALDDVCPKRLEVVESETATIPADSTLPDFEEDSFLNELLSDIAGIGAETKEEVKAEKKEIKKIKTKDRKTSLAEYFIKQLREFDPETYDPSDSETYNKCDRPRQPVILSDDEIQKFKEEELSEYDPEKLGDNRTLKVKDPDGTVICPEYWCTVDRIPLKESQLEDGKCPVCNGKVRSTIKAQEKKQDVVEYSVIKRDSSSVFPGYIKYKSKKTNKPIPCCFSTAQTSKISHRKPEAVSTREVEPFYVLGENKTNLEELRFAYIPKIVGRALGITLDYKTAVESLNRIQNGQSGFFRAGVGHATDSLGKVIGDLKKIPSPLEVPEITKRCSFFRSWSKADLSEVEDKISARVYSINQAFEEKNLTKLEELEYTALCLNCIVYMVYIKNNELHSACFMNVKPANLYKKAILVLVNPDDVSNIDYVVHVSRTSMLPTINGNVYDKKLFPNDLYPTLEKLRKKSCIRDIPTIEKAVAFIHRSELKDRLPEVKLIMDPYMRVQALIIPKTIILPFRPTSQVPTVMKERVHGYSEIPQSDYPSKEEMIEFLYQAKNIHPGYEYAHDSVNSQHKVVEIVTKSGLRIPVLSDEVLESTFPTEITETVSQADEETIVYGEPDKESVKLKQSITYEAEIFEFLLFQLTKDMYDENHDYEDLKQELGKQNPNKQTLKPLIKQWMDDTLSFTGADTPITFYSKMRHSCTGSAKSECDGLCVWDGASCKVQVKQVRPTLERSVLENRLVSTLTSNDKIRSVVFENRVSPFFSSILYLELPSETILSDSDVASKLRE